MQEMNGIKKRELTGILFFLCGFVWLNLAAGWVVIDMGTWKFVPAYLLFALSLVWSISTHPEPFSLKSDSPGFLLLLLALSVFLNVLPGSINGDNYDLLHNAAGRVSLLLIAATSVLTVDNEKKRKIFIFAAFTVLMVLSALGLVQAIQDSLHPSPYYRGIEGTFYNPNLFAGTLILYIPLVGVYAGYFKTWRFRLILSVCAVLALLVLLFTGCRSAIIGVLAAFLLGLGLYNRLKGPGIRRKKIIVLFIILLILLVIILALLMPSVRIKFQTLDAKGGEPRLRSFSAAIRMWLRSPRSFLIGNGAGSFRTLLPRYSYSWYNFYDSKTSWHAVHNEYLELLVEGGLAALLSFLVFLFFLMRKLIKVIGDESKSRFDRFLSAGILLSMTAFLTDSLFSTNFRELPQAGLFYVLALLPLGREERPSGQTRRRMIPLLQITVISVLLIFSLSRHLVRLYTDRVLYVASRIDQDDRKIEILKLASSVEPGYVVPAMMLTREYLGQGKTDDFFDQADRVEAIIPSFLDIHYLRGQAYGSLGMDEAAAQEYLLHLNSGFYDLNAETALMFSRLWLGENEKAMQVFKRILEKDRVTSPIHFTIEYSPINGIEIGREPLTMTVGEDYIKKKLIDLASGSDRTRTEQIMAFYEMMVELYDAAGLDRLRNIHENQIRKYRSLQS